MQLVRPIAGLHPFPRGKQIAPRLPPETATTVGPSAGGHATAQGREGSGSAAAPVPARGRGPCVWGVPVGTRGACQPSGWTYWSLIGPVELCLVRTWGRKAGAGQGINEALARLPAV